MDNDLFSSTSHRALLFNYKSRHTVQLTMTKPPPNERKTFFFILFWVLHNLLMALNERKKNECMATKSSSFEWDVQPNVLHHISLFWMWNDMNNLRLVRMREKNHLNIFFPHFWKSCDYVWESRFEDDLNKYGIHHSTFTIEYVCIFGN